MQDAIKSVYTLRDSISNLSLFLKFALVKENAKKTDAEEENTKIFPKSTSAINLRKGKQLFGKIYIFS